MAKSDGIIELNDFNFDETVISSNQVSLVDFWAPWCGPCKMLTPILAEVAEELKGKDIVIGKMNVDENPVVAGRYKIMSIPTMLIFKNGKIVDQLMGAQPKSDILKRLMSAMNL